MENMTPKYSTVFYFTLEEGLDIELIKAEIKAAMDVVAEAENTGDDTEMLKLKPIEGLGMGQKLISLDMTEGYAELVVNLMRVPFEEEFNAWLEIQAENKIT